jgi:hydrogenase small subunit
MPGFPDKFMPFMDEPPGAVMSSRTATAWGSVIRRLREITNHSVDAEPKWRHNRPELTTGYNPRFMNQRNGGDGRGNGRTAANAPATGGRGTNR